MCSNGDCENSRLFQYFTAILRPHPRAGMRRCVVTTRSVLAGRMGFRPIEPRVGVALTVMSLALLFMLKRGSAFRSGPTASCAFSRGNPGRSAAAAATATTAAAAATAAGAVQSRHTGPEGTELPDVMHRTVSAEELKVGWSIDAQITTTDCTADTAVSVVVMTKQAWFCTAVVQSISYDTTSRHFSGSYA